MFAGIPPELGPPHPAHTKQGVSKSPEGGKTVLGEVSRVRNGESQSNPSIFYSRPVNTLLH